MFQCQGIVVDHEQLGVPTVGFRVAGVDAECLLEGAFAVLPVPVVIVVDPAETGVGLGDAVVEFERGLQFLLGFGIGDDGRGVSVGGEHAVAVRDADVCEGKAGILGQREFEVRDGGGHVFLGTGVPECAALKVEVVCLEVVRLALGQTRLVSGVQFDGKALGDALGNFALDGEDIAFLFVKRLGPKIGLGAGIDQFDDHAQLAASLPDAAGDDGVDLKRLADCPGVVRLFLEPRAVLDHQVGGHGEHGVDLLVHAFGEKIVFLLRANVA